MRKIPKCSRRRCHERAMEKLSHGLESPDRTGSGPGRPSRMRTAIPAEDSVNKKRAYYGASYLPLAFVVGWVMKLPGPWWTFCEWEMIASWVANYTHRDCRTITVGAWSTSRLRMMKIQKAAGDWVRSETTTGFTCGPAFGFHYRPQWWGRTGRSDVTCRAAAAGGWPSTRTGSGRMRESEREREREREEGGQGKHETGLNQKKKSRTSSLISLCRWIHHGAASPVRPTRHSSDGRGWHLRPPPFSDPRTDQSARAWRGRHSQRQSRNW